MPKSPLCLLLIFLSATGAAMAGPWRATEGNSYGWEFMTPDERVEHQRRLRASRSFEECQAYQAEHHALMAERARQAGVVLTPKTESACERWRAQGRWR